jgi:hypothetical protein
MAGMMGGGGQAGGLGTSDVLRGPDYQYNPTSRPPTGDQDQLKRLAAQLQIASAVSGLAGAAGEATQGPGGSPLRPMGAGSPFAFTPTANQFARRPQRLRDLL